MSVGCFEERARSLASIIYCKVGKLSVIYLGLPVGAKKGSQALLNSMIEKVK